MIMMNNTLMLIAVYVILVFNVYQILTTKNTIVFSVSVATAVLLTVDMFAVMLKAMKL